MSTVGGCPLCKAAGGRIVVQAPRWRIVHADEAGFPAFYRLVWQDHVREFSQLPRQDRVLCTDILVAMEEALVSVLQPEKVNLASLGNAVPHLHWHVIARFAWDSHFPGAVWSAPQRPAPADRVQAVVAALPAIEEKLRAALAPLLPA